MLTHADSLNHRPPATLKVFQEHQQKHLKFDYPMDWNSTPQPECKAFCVEVFYYVLAGAVESPLDNLLENLDINAAQEKSPIKGGPQKEEQLTEGPTNVLEGGRTGEPSKGTLQT